MRVSHHHRTQLMQGAILVSIISALILWGYREWTKPFGQDDLKIDVSDLRSHISEGQRITEQASSGTVTSPYFKSQILMLVDKTEVVQKQLEDAKPVPDLELKLWEV